MSDNKPIRTLVVVGKDKIEIFKHLKARKEKLDNEHYTNGHFVDYLLSLAINDIEYEDRNKKQRNN